MAWALVFISCFKGTINCTSNIKYFDNYLSCIQENDKYVLQGSCIKNHVSLVIGFPKEKNK